MITAIYSDVMPIALMDKEALKLKGRRVFAHFVSLSELWETFLHPCEHSSECETFSNLL